METTYRNIQLVSQYLGNKNWDSDYTNYNNHKVTVKNLDTGKWTWFEFWESIRDVEIQTEDQLLFAFYCFLMDALAGEMEFLDFCNEYGYDSFDQRAKKTWRACKKDAEKVKRILPGVDTNEIVNELQEERSF